MRISQDDVDHRFNYHPPRNEEEVGRHENVRSELKWATKNVLEGLPPSREASLFVTKMEEAMMWANAAIARNKESTDE